MKEISNIFWLDFIHALSQYKSEPTTSQEYVSQDSLNLVTKYNIKSCTRWTMNGVLLIKHRFVAQGYLSNFDEIKQATHTNNFIQCSEKKKIESCLESENTFHVILDKT